APAQSTPRAPAKMAGPFQLTCDIGYNLRRTVQITTPAIEIKSGIAITVSKKTNVPAFCESSTLPGPSSLARIEIRLSSSISHEIELRKRSAFPPNREWLLVAKSEVPNTTIRVFLVAFESFCFPETATATLR